jgi:subtilisin family serine protease
VKFKAGASETDKQRSLGWAGAHIVGEIPQIGVKIVELPPQASETAQARAFGQQGHVEFAELDGIVRPAMVPNDPRYPTSWHLPKVGCPEAWDTTVGSANIVIAILDSGVEGTHPDLADKLVPGWNFYDNNADTSDFYGHGTGVAGVASASGNNAAGVASVAWGCSIMPLRVSNPSGCATWSTLASAITWAADHGARVANASFGYSDSTSVTSAAQYLASRGGVLTFSAGNEATFSSAADNPYVLTISASDQSDAIASWSNTGNNIDLAAPGVSVTTTTPGGTYGAGSGTSFSAPVVAGVAALVMSANPSLTAAQVQDVLKQSADDLGPPGWDPQYGWGRVNAARAVAMAATVPAPTPDTTPPTVSFGSPSAGSTVSGTASVLVNASDNVGVTSVSLFVDGVPFATTSSAPFSFAWNTVTASNGSHTLEARAADAAGNTAAVTMGVMVNNVGDFVPPVVAITSPQNGATVRNTVSVSVSSSDNVGVIRVELYVDGAIKASSTTAPFTTSWNSRKASNGAHTLSCKAYDAARKCRTIGP